MKILPILFITLLLLTTACSKEITTEEAPKEEIKEVPPKDQPDVKEIEKQLEKESWCVAGTTWKHDGKKLTIKNFNKYNGQKVCHAIHEGTNYYISLDQKEVWVE